MDMSLDETKVAVQFLTDDLLLEVDGGLCDIQHQVH